MRFTVFPCCFRCVLQFQPDALVYAVAYGTANDVELLIKEFGTYSIDVCMNPLGLSALHMAVIKGDVATCRVLLDAGK